MPIDTYPNLVSELSNTLDDSFATSDSQTFVAMAETKINRELRVSAMETAISSGTITSGVWALPTGFREFKSLYVTGSPVRVLQPASYDTMILDYPVRAATAKPSVFAISGTNVEFGPFPDADYILGGVYYGAFTALSTASPTNWLTTDAPDLLFFASLETACRFTRDDQNMATYRRLYEESKRAILEEDKRKRFSSRISLGGIAR